MTESQHPRHGNGNGKGNGKGDALLVSDEQLLLLYYGESDDPQLAARVAASPELSARLERLSAELEALDHWDHHSPHRDSEYGRRIWARIEPQLPARGSAPSWLSALLQPRWSWAGLATLVVVASLAFWLGGRGLPPGPTTGGDPAAWQGAAMDAFLAQHLNDAERWLAHVANQPADAAALDATWTQSLLQNNRLYRISLQQGLVQPTQYNASTVSRVLDDFEFILLQSANQSPGLHTAAQRPDQRSTRTPAERVLFQLRVLNRQWSTLPSSQRGMQDEHQTRT